MKAADLPFCPACQECPPVANSEQDHYRDVKHLKTVAERDAYPIVPTEHRHTIPENQLLALYTIRDGVPCSNPDRRIHNDGLIVQAACGAVLAMGYDCGAQLVENFRRIEDVAKRAREYNAFLSTATARLADIRARYDAALARGRALFAYRERLRAELPYFARELSEVRDDQVPGAELFDWQRGDLDRRFGELRELEWARAKWVEALPPLREQRERMVELKTLEERLDDFEAWTRVASVLMTRSGFERAAERIDSQYRTKSVSAFDPRTGTEVTRQREVLERTRVRCASTPDGIDDRISGRTIFIEWIE